MGTAIFVVVNDSITADLSVRTIFGAMVALCILLIATSLFRKYKNVQEILFVLLVGVVVLASTVLITTAFIHSGVTQ